LVAVQRCGRDQLRRVQPGERLILASFCPFNQPGPSRAYGPVFVLQEPDNNSAGEQTLPPLKGSDSDYLKIVLRAYDVRVNIVTVSWCNRIGLKSNWTGILLGMKFVCAAAFRGLLLLRVAF
jgi:hypothetical protein